MPPSEQQSLIIIVLVADHPGMVNTVIQLSRKCRCDIENCRMTIFGQQFLFIIMLSNNWQSISLIEAALLKQGAKLELLFIMPKITYTVYKEYFSIIIAKVNVTAAIV